MARVRVRGIFIEGATSVEPPATGTVPVAPAVPGGGRGAAAGTPRVRRTAVDRIVPMEEEIWHIHGQGMSKWTEKHIYWVLPIGTLLLFCLIFWATGLSFKQSGAVGGSQPAIVQPVVVQQVLPPPATPMPPSSAELTPEELDKRHTEHLRRHGQ